MLQIIIADWADYPLTRQKSLGADVTFECGILPLLSGFRDNSAGMPIEATLIVTSENQIDIDREVYEALAKTFPFLRKIIYRDNSGFDLGSYNRGLKELRAEGYDGRVLFVNTSARAPKREGWASEYEALFTNSHYPVGLCGISMTTYRPWFVPRVLARYWIEKPHVQSFFLYSDMRVLSKCFPTDLPGSKLFKKRALIRDGETAISQAVLSNGFSITSRMDPAIYQKGSKWPGRLKPGFRAKRKYMSETNKI